MTEFTAYMRARAAAVVIARTERQIAALELRKQGLTLRAIAGRLGCSHLTVKRDIDSAIKLANEWRDQLAGGALEK